MLFHPLHPNSPRESSSTSAVWVWDGSWWPATVTRALVHRGERVLIVRFERDSQLLRDRIVCSLATRISAAPTSHASQLAYAISQRHQT